MALYASKLISSEFENLKRLAVANNEFAFKLRKTFASYGNAFTSPASIFAALGMLYQGARGVTAEEMQETLSYGVAELDEEKMNQYFQELLSLLGNASDEYKFDIANAIVLQAEFSVLKEYKDVLIKYYDAILKEVDFVKENVKALEEINNWVKTKTRSKIPKLLESLDPDTVLVLLNAVYFKGTWKTQFSPRNTREDTFYNDGENAVNVPMMGTKNEFFYGCFHEHGVQAVRLPYNGEDISMIVILPFVKQGLSNLEQELTSNKLDDIISKMEVHTVIVNIPKFKLEDKKELKRNLTTLGMESAFTNGADFTGIAKERRMKVSKIFHEAVIEVNEEGSEAAGATAILGMQISAGPHCTKSFHANHPFIFFIRDDRTGMVLFYGRVNTL